MGIYKVAWLKRASQVYPDLLGPLKVCNIRALYFPSQVGAAISMTYITSKPIVFVGTGQTYCDLRSLNAKAVVAALMKA